MDTPEVKPIIHDVPTSRKILGGLGTSKFYEEVRDGNLKLVKIGRRSFCTDAELSRYVEALEGAAAGCRPPPSPPNANRPDEAPPGDSWIRSEQEESEPMSLTYSKICRASSPASKPRSSYPLRWRPRYSGTYLVIAGLGGVT